MTVRLRDMGDDRQGTRVYIRLLIRELVCAYGLVNIVG